MYPANCCNCYKKYDLDQTRVEAWSLWFCSGACKDFYEQRIHAGKHIIEITKVTNNEPHGWPVMIHCEGCKVTEIVHSQYAAKPERGDLWKIEMPCMRHFTMKKVEIQGDLKPVSRLFRWPDMFDFLRR